MKKILVVVDYQNDFVCGSYGFKMAEDLEELICHKINQNKKEKQGVLFTLDTHFGDTYEIEKTGVDKNELLKGWELYGRVKDYHTKETKTISKHTIASLDLGAYLLKEHYDSIEFVGLVTNVCILANAIIARAACPEADIIIDASCVTSNDNELHEKALDIMEGLKFQVNNRSNQLK